MDDNWTEAGGGRGHTKSESSDRAMQENGIDSDIDFSDEEDFVDDITDEELLGDLLAKKPKETDGIDSVIVVDNIPSVGVERLEKLQNVIRKIFSKFGKIVNEHYPKGEDGSTKGYIFLEYSSPNNAAEAVKMTNGYKLDRQHTFAVNLFSDFEKYSDVEDDWEPPEAQPFKDPGNLHSWLTQEDCLDQYSVIYDGGERTAILLNNPTEPSLLEERARWTETYVRWSPKGTYLATFHGKGIALWGGEKFKQIMRYSHTGVQLIDFSPCERYVVTFSPLPDNKEEPQAIIIWDIRTGKKKRGFHCENASVWPIFKWSSSGEYFCRSGPDSLSIYETPSFGLLDKKSMKISNIKDFSWSPSDNILSYWVPEDGNIPARVTLIEIPSRRDLSTKNLFNVADCKMHWQKNGDYLGVKVDRYTKIRREKDSNKYSGLYHNFELFRIREKQIPVDKLEIKEPISAFAWEPNGHRFAFLHGENPRISLSVYVMEPKGKVVLVKTLEKKTANHLFWSPQGQFLVMAGLRSMNGVLEFIDTTDMTVMAQTEHFMATDVEWDPTGRYVSSAVSWWGHKVDNAYWIWSFQGKLLQKHPMDRFCQLLWRPKPASLLTTDMIKEIKRNMKKYSAQFELKDRMSQSKASKELIEKRRELIASFEAYRSKCEQMFAETLDWRMDARAGMGEDEDEDDLADETIEFLVKVEETVIDE